MPEVTVTALITILGFLEATVSSIGEQDHRDGYKSLTFGLGV
jgi:hypothetical protein